MDDNHPFKKAPLLTWGIICLCGAVVTASLTQFVLPMVMPKPRNSAEAMGAAFGQAAALILIAVVGVVLIVMHFVKQR